MSVRIYALAKELKLDSKELVDICTKAGIPGKGSALASLTDAEVVRVKEFLAGGKTKPKRAKAEPLPMPEPPKNRAPSSGKMPVIIPKRKASPRPAPLAPSRRVDLESPLPTDEPEAQTPTTPPSVPDQEAASATPSPTLESSPTESLPPPPPSPSSSPPSLVHGAEEFSPVRRDDYIGFGASQGKLPVVGDKSKRKGSKRNGGQDAGQRTRPTIKLAPLPAMESPSPSKPKSQEPAPQKPDMKLPADIVRATTSGQSRPLAAHLRRAERVVEAEKRQRMVEESMLSDEQDRRGESRHKRRNRNKGGGEDSSVLYSREQRQLRRQKSELKQEGERPIRRITRRHKRTGINTAAPRKDRIILELPCTVRQFSEAAGVPAAQIQRILIGEGVMTTINAELEPDLAEFIASELGADIEFTQPKTLEERVLNEIRQKEDAPESLQPRAPIITFLGHVDHGKTSLLDKIIGLNVAGGESGGITQHIRAYEIQREGRKIAFVDTPGHEAFTEMRARGANVTDIAVLVVAADDGVMPQTEEAISHLRAAGVPIVVALNKIDLPDIDPGRALQQLSANNLVPSEWGGDIEVIHTSAQTGEGIEDLLETLLTVAELNEYKANPNRAAYGTCLESRQESGRGVVAKMIVQNGTLKVGDIVVCGQAYGRIKAMFNTLDECVRMHEAPPSTPVNVTGFNDAPDAGEHFYVLDDVTQARHIAEQRASQLRQTTLSGRSDHVTLETLFDRLEGADDIQTLNVIIRADVRGSIEAIRKEFEKLEHPEVRVDILQATVGGITIADITLADASDAIVIGFNVVPEEGARQLAEQRGVQIRRYEVIYKITDDLRAALEGMLRPEEREISLGRALVQRAFKISRIGTIAGCRVLAGSVQRNARARVIRESTIIGDYAIDTLRREKDDTREVREGFECGIKLAGFNDVKEADVLEVYRIEEIGRTFDH
ncbi:MAG: translation initiation factor IF-2 [Pirellulales bacterium]|nr:translation initiation factor IF-2 [Pirellulales bacterium]